MKKYEVRWKNVEAGQLGLKQNLVKYNNFVKEKQAKMADSVSFILMEKQKQSKLVKKIQIITSELDVLEEAKTFFEDIVDNKVVFRNFLSLVFRRHSELFKNIDEVINRSQALADARSSLKLRLVTANMTKDEEVQILTCQITKMRSIFYRKKV